MKEIKTAKYKNIFANTDNRKELALKLMDWHGGQFSPLYSVGSSWLAGKDVPNNIIEEAIKELEDIAQKKVNYPQNITDENIMEIKQLQQELKRNMGYDLPQY